MLFLNRDSSSIKRAFGVDLIASNEMNSAIRKWSEISTGQPPWLSEDVTTINLAKHIADYRARLTTLDIGIAISGAGSASSRAEYLQGLADELLNRLPDRISDADRLGGCIIKWNGQSWDFILPGDFGITAKDSNGNITGAIFASYTVQENASYTRLEYHRFDGDTYVVTNKAFRNVQAINSDETHLGSEIPLEKVDVWANLAPEVRIANVSKPLFGFYRVPGSNIIDSTSPLGLSVFDGALPELRALDVAISRKNDEIEDSRHVTFVSQSAIQYAERQNDSRNPAKVKIKLPRYVMGLGVDVNNGDGIHEHTTTLQTEQRIRDINFDLSLAGVKSGFSEGVFVLDGQTGMITATQVEADDRDTIQTIKTDRDALKTALDQAFYGADVLATLYNLAPAGEYEVVYNFGDITYSYEEDKASWQRYVTNGWVAPHRYLMRFEGMSEEDARALVAEAREDKPKSPGLFGEE